MYINIYIKLFKPGDKIAGNGGGATGPTIAAATSGGRGGGISSPMRAAAVLSMVTEGAAAVSFLV